MRTATLIRRRVNALARVPQPPVQTTAIPYQKIVRDEAYSYDLAQHVYNAHTFALAPGSPALPAGVTLAANGALTGPATAAAMSLIPVVRATNTVSGLFIDMPFDLSAAQRPTALAAPVLTEPSAGVLRVAKPTIPANTPAVDHVDILYGLVNPPTLANATLVVDAFPGAATELDIPDQIPGDTIYVTTRPAVAWGDGSFLYPNPPFSANIASRTITTPIVNVAPTGSNKSLDFNIPAPDTAAPTLTSSIPADGATGVSTSASITLTFSEAVVLAATGTLTIREDAGGGFADWEVFDLSTDIGTGAGKVSASGAEVLLTPTTAMVAGRSYAVRISAGAVKDTAGNSFAGIADDTTLNWTVAAAPADVAFVQTATILNDYSATGIASWTSLPFTVGTGPNRALLFSFRATAATAGGAAASTVTPTITASFNGQPVTVSGYRYHTSDRCWVAYGFLPNPTSGSGTLSMTTSSNQYAMTVEASEFINCHQSTQPAALGGSQNTAGTAITNNGTTTQPGSALLSALASTRRAGNPTADITVSSGTMLSATHTPGATDLQTGYSASAYKLKATAGADSITYTLPESGPRCVWQSIEVFRA